MPLILTGDVEKQLEGASIHDRDWNWKPLALDLATMCRNAIGNSKAISDVPSSD